MTHGIEWLNRPGTVGESWNPITGCTPISEGCKHCYARRMAKRLAGRYGYPEVPHEFDVTEHYDRLFQPLHWKKPRTVFVCSMSDVFHPNVSDYLRTRMFDVMADERCEQHTFIILTKRPKLIADWDWWVSEHWPGDTPWNVTRDVLPRWPDNIWLGVSAENQERWDERVRQLRAIPATVRFVSVEPMLGPIVAWHDIPHQEWETVGSGPNVTGAEMVWVDGAVDWVICGAETGLGARPMDISWPVNLRDECQAVGVPFFFKRVSPGQETPPDLQVREWPC